MVLGTIKQGPYVDVLRIERFARLKNVHRHPSALMVARRGAVLDLMLLDGTIRKGIRLTKGIIYELDFLQIVDSTPRLSQLELWAFYLPSNLKAVSYV
jgi:hypothetical protein